MNVKNESTVSGIPICHFFSFSFFNFNFNFCSTIDMFVSEFKLLNKPISAWAWIHKHAIQIRISFRVLRLLEMQLNQWNNIKHAPFRWNLFIRLFTLSACAQCISHRTLALFISVCSIENVVVQFDTLRHKLTSILNSFVAQGINSNLNHFETIHFR